MGLLAAGMGREVLCTETGLLGKEELYRMKYMTVEPDTLFWYILEERMKNTIILAVLATTYLGIVAAGITAAGFGVNVGIFLAAALIQYGVKGILLFLAGTLPQYVVYVPALYFLVLWCERVCRGIYFDKKIISGNQRELLVKLLQILGIITLIIIGSALESYINTLLLKKLLKIF